MKYLAAFIVACCLGLGEIRARADVLTLKDGDTLSGTLVDIRGGTLSFRTKLAGKVFYPVDVVAGIATANPVAVALKDDRLLYGRLRSKEGSTIVEDGNGDPSDLIQLADVTGIDAVPASATVPASKSDDPGIAVSAEMGYRWRTGTLDYSGPFTRIELSNETDASETRLRFEGEYVGDAGSFNRFFELEGRVQLGDPVGWRPEFELDVERNRDKALDIRGDFSIGLSRRVLDADSQRLEATAGVGAAIEEFDAEPLRRDQGARVRTFLNETRIEDEEIHGTLSLRYTRHLFSNGYVQSDLDLRPSLSDLGDLRAKWGSALLVPITPRMRLRMDFLVDYDDDPKYRGLDEWRTSVGASIRVDF